MSETKVRHTPAPWKCGTKGFTMSDLMSWQILPVGTRTDRISQADLNLIAAAPELYDAVLHVLIASEDGGDFNDVDFKMLRDAIAKAEGR